MKEYKRHLVTAALPYANGPLHIGHIAGAYLPADIYVRFLRMKGEEVVFICGSDEHGAAITLRAKKEGTTPKEIVDKYHELNKATFKSFGIDFSVYHRTSSPLHKETAQDFFLKLHEKGAFEEKTSEQFYDEKEQQFLADRYVTGTCPKCQSEGAYGDQCEKCGSSLSSDELINPKSTLSGETPIKKETSHWFLPMQNHESWIQEWISKGVLDGLNHHDPATWRKQVLGQCKSWIDGGLQARAMTRDLDWGVPVPIEGANGKVLYVWLDAPIGYITATKAWASQRGQSWEKYWQNDETAMTHFIGKDNIVFHCIIFPILLKVHGNYNLPVNVPANEFLNLEGQKLSTSRNWAVWLNEYLEDMPNKEDVLRYVLTSIAPESKDSEFTWKDYQARNNNELVAILGNFVNRALVLTNKYYNGKVPKQHNLEAIDAEVLGELAKVPAQISNLITHYKFREAQTQMMALARLGNKYLADTEPWKLQKENPQRVETIMNIALQLVANLAIAAYPFLPRTARKIENMLSYQGLNWEDFGKSDILEEGHTIGEASLLFEKIEDALIDTQIAKLQEKASANAPKVEPVEEESGELLPFGDTANFEDFLKMDLRVGTIIEAEKVKKSKKLLKFLVDTGHDKRTVVSGVALHFTPEELLGKQVTLLANLAPRAIMGIESQGMILFAETPGGKLVRVAPDVNVPAGSKIA